MSGEPTVRRQTDVVPAVPASVPPICEGGSHGSRLGSPERVIGSPVPPYRGDGEREPGTKRLWYPINAARHRLTNHRCGEFIMAALDHWACALTVYLDPWPLTPAGEVAALRDGRRTYQMRSWGVRIRNAYRIAGNPPRPGTTVLAEHRCGDPIPATWRQSSPTRTPTTNNTQEVPF